MNSTPFVSIVCQFYGPGKPVGGDPEGCAWAHALSAARTERGARKALRRVLEGGRGYLMEVYGFSRKALTGEFMEELDRQRIYREIMS